MDTSDPVADVRRLLPVGRRAALAAVALVAFNTPIASAAPAADYTVRASIAVDGIAEGIAVSPDGRTAYVTHGEGDAGTLSKIDTATNTVTQSVPMDGFPIGLAVSRDGTTIYVGDNSNDTLSVVDTASLTTRTVLPTGDGPLGVAITPDGSKVVVASQFDGNFITVDTATNSVKELAVGERSLFVAVSPDSQTAYITDLFDYSITVVDLVSNQVTRRIPTGDALAISVDVAESGKTLFATFGGARSEGGDGVMTIDIESGAITDFIPAAPVGGIDVAPDDSVAYLVQDRSVHIIDVPTRTVIDTVPTPANGQHVSVAPDSSAAYTTSQLSTVTVIGRDEATVQPGPPSTGSSSLFGS